MEATKIKKTYLSPEMNRFEMKMEAAFMSASREEVEIIIPESEVEGLLHSKCTDNGTAFNQLIPGGDCQTFGAQHITDSACGLWGKMVEAGLDLKEKSNVIVCRKYDDGYGNRVYTGKLTD